MTYVTVRDVFDRDLTSKVYHCVVLSVRYEVLVVVYTLAS